MKAIGEGVAHVGDYLAGFDPAGAPFFNITMLVPTFTDNGYAVAMACRRLAELPEAKAELEKKKVKFLSPSGTLGDYLHTRKPVTKLADIKGLKIRSWGPFAEMVKLWEATPVMMPPAEVYTALERGVVDGNNQSLTLIYSSRNHERAKHFLMFNMGLNVGAPTVMNLKMWKSLPRDIQKIVEEVSLEYTERFVKQWEQDESEVIAKMKTEGCEFHEIGPEQKKELFEKAKPVLELQVQILDKQGLPGKKIQETYFSYIREYEKKGKK
jgi:TRAP-type C4-dicarboxylate transport system substrate-binding protein